MEDAMGDKLEKPAAHKSVRADCDDDPVYEAWKTRLHDGRRCSDVGMEVFEPEQLRAAARACSPRKVLIEPLSARRSHRQRIDGVRPMPKSEART
jgi:hypothetical protein